MWVIAVKNKTGTLRFQHSVYADSVRVGRAPDNEIVLQGDDVSRHHGCIEVCDGRLVYRDLDSRNGSYVMTRRVEGAVPLSIGSVIEIADFLLTVEPDPDLSQPGRFIEHAPTEVITGPSTRGAAAAGWSSAIDLLKVLRRNARRRVDGDDSDASRRRREMDHEWSQLLAAAMQLRAQLHDDPRVQAFELSEDRREVSVKLRNASRNGGSSYLILSRGYPDRPEADAHDAVWLREIGGSDRRFTDARRAFEALVRQIALHTPT